MLRTRAATAAVALAITLGAVRFAPPWLFSALVGALGAWGLYEVAIMTGAGARGSGWALTLGGGCPLALLLLAGDIAWIPPAAVIAAMLVLVGVIAVRGPGAGPRGWRLTLLGALYVGVLFPYFALLREAPDGAPLLILTLLVVVATDSAAYFAGSGFGRHKLAPRVSPHKTVEGALAGLFAGTLAGLMVRPLLAPRWGYGAAVVFAALAAGLAEFGDLAGSALKRASGVKDAGWIFPGHGGLLDRADSLVFAAVFAYYYSR